MNGVDTLAGREIDGELRDSIAVGVHILGMSLSFTNMTDTDAERWMKWHNKWEAMDRGTQDSYLILLALKGDQ